MKLNIHHKKEENTLFSIDLNNKESKTIIFAPNGVGKSSITEVISNYKNFKNINNFFHSMSEEAHLNIKIFKEENYKNHEIIGPDIDNYNKDFLTNRLREQKILEGEGVRCKMALDPLPSSSNSYERKNYNFPISVALTSLTKISYSYARKNSSNYIKDENMRVIPNIREFGHSNLYNTSTDHLFLSKERIDSIIKLIDLHQPLIICYKYMGEQKKRKQYISMYRSKLDKIRSTSKKILQETFPVHNISRYSLNSFWCNDDTMSFISGSGDFILTIYRYDPYHIPRSYFYLDDLIEEEIHEGYKKSLISYKNELLGIKENLDSLRSKFKSSKWMSGKEYNKNLEDTKENIKNYMIKEKGSYCNFIIEHSKTTPFTFSLKITPKKSFSKGERKKNVLLFFLNLIFDSEKLDLIILDDPVTSLDYFHTSTIITWLKGFKSSFLLLTHNFSFFSKFMSKEMNKLPKDVYIMDKFDYDKVFSIELKESDFNFSLGKFVNFWEGSQLSVDEFIFTFDLVYELLKSFSISTEKKGICKNFVSSIDYFVRHSREKLNGYKPIKTIRNFYEKSKKSLDHYIEIFLINIFMENYKNLNKSNSIIDIDLEKHVEKGDEGFINKYKEKIKNKKLSFFNYLTMKHLLIRCCNAKYKLLENKKTNKSTKAIYDQIKSLKHFESLRFIPLLEISCETIVNYINYLNEELKEHKNK